MLDRDHDLGRAHRLVVFVLQRHLAFRIGAEQRRHTGVARLREGAQHGVSIKYRRRHQCRRLVAGKSEHHALVAGPFVLVAGGVDPLRDVGRLTVDVALDRRPLPMKILLLVADVADRLARHFDQLLAGDFGGPANLAGENHAIGRDQRLDTAARFGFGGEIGVDDRVGNTIADLVGMTFRHGLAGKNKITFGQGFTPPEITRLTTRSSRLMQPCRTSVKPRFWPGGGRGGGAAAAAPEKRYFSGGRSLPVASALASSNRRRRTLGSSMR